MRTRLLPFIAALLTATALHAEGIRYDRIPADATSYFHLDIDRLLHTAAVQKAPNAQDLLHHVSDYFPANSDITMYETHTRQADKADGFVLLWHSPEPDFQNRIRAVLAKVPGNLAITYDQQPITLADTPPTHLLITSTPPAPATEPATPPEKPHPDAPPPHNRFMLGLSDGSDVNPDKAPAYVAFVGNDLVLLSSDLRSISQALDVIHGKRPSLAQQDPNGIKITLPPGTFVIATGLSAQFQNQNDDKPTTTQPAPNLGGALGLDMFGTLKAQARIATFDVGENEQSLFADASIAMKEEDAATQLKNLIVGTKALVSLTQPKSSPLLDRLDIQSSNKDVSLHWSWPVAKLGDLYTLLDSQGNDGDAASTSRPNH